MPMVMMCQYSVIFRTLFSVLCIYYFIFMPTIWGNYWCSLSPFYWHVERLTFPNSHSGYMVELKFWLRPTDMALSSKPCSLWPPWRVHPESCLVLCNLWTVVHQAPLSMGFSRQEYWSMLQFLTPGDPPNPGIKPISLTISCMSSWILYH